MGRWLIARFSTRLGFDRLSDVASVPLVLMLIEVSSLFLSPVALAYSRYQEHEADRFALDLTHANHSAAMAFVKMQSENLGNPRPGPFYKIFRSSPPEHRRADRLLQRLSSLADGARAGRRRSGSQRSTLSTDERGDGRRLRVRMSAFLGTCCA